MSKRCSYCGDDMPDDGFDCPGCGARVAIVDQRAAAPKVPDITPAPVDPSVESNNGVARTITTASLLVAMGVSPVIYLSKGPSTQPVRTEVSGSNVRPEDLANAANSRAAQFSNLKFMAAMAMLPSDQSLATAKTDTIDGLIDNLNKIPATSPDYKEAKDLIKQLNDKRQRIIHFHDVMGPKPEALADGKIQSVEEYLSQTLKDYQNAQEISWSAVRVVYEKDEPYWTVDLRLGEKNAVGKLIIHNAVFFLRNNQVLKATGL